MANTTFKGTVRAEGGLSVISTADSTGIETTHTSISSSTGNTSIGGTLGVTGATTLSDQLLVNAGSQLKYTADATHGPTDVIFGKNGSLGITADPFTVSASQLFPLGTKLVYGDKTFRYAFSGAAIAAGVLIQQAAAVANHRDIATAAASAGASTVTVTLGSTAATLNQYAEGYLHVNDVAGQGQLLRIKSHPAADSSATCVITLYDYVVVALTTSSKIDLIQSSYIDVVTAPTAETGGIIGATPIAVADDRYFWAQTTGPASVLTVGTIVLGHKVCRSDSTAGGVEPVATDSILNDVGNVMVVNGTADNSVIMLNIE